MSSRQELEKFCDKHMLWVNAYGHLHQATVAEKIAMVAGVSFSPMDFIEPSSERMLRALEQKLANGDSLDEIHDA